MEIISACAWLAIAQPVRIMLPRKELAHANTGGMGDSVHQGRDDIPLVVAREEYAEHAASPPEDAEDASSGLATIDMTSELELTCAACP